VVIKIRRILIFDAILLGVVGAAAAQLFNLMLRISERVFLEGIGGYVAPGLAHEGGSSHQVIGPHGLWLVPVSLFAGGLISGLLVYFLAPEAEGHGTDTAVKAFHRQAGKIRRRIAPLKLLASAITIGSGGAAGREGPTALISSGIGSIYATLVKRSEQERRILVLAGMAAGLSAIFRSPIGTAIFAIEVLYSDWDFEAEALIYTMLASLVAYTLNGSLSGWDPMFTLPAGMVVKDLVGYAWYVPLGVGAGLIGAALPNVFYGTRALFRHIPLPPHVKPAIGALGVGALALVLPQILGGGYGWIQQAMDGKLTMLLLLYLLLGKMIAFSLTVSSGGSGGVFAPALFVGAMYGGLMAQLFHQPSAPFVLVGMAAVFGGSARVPIATLLMVMEMTGGYKLLPPAALAIITGYLVQSRLVVLLPYRSLYEAQVRHRPDSPAHRMEHLRAAFRMLAERGGIKAEEIGHIDLLGLLESHVPLDLPDGKQLFLGTLSADSAIVGQAIGSISFISCKDDCEIVAVLRDDHLLLPHPDLSLKPGDQLLLLITRGSWDAVKPHFVRVEKS
jgi:CIC family chloride channel protein